MQRILDLRSRYFRNILHGIEVLFCHPIRNVFNEALMRRILDVKNILFKSSIWDI